MELKGINIEESIVEDSDFMLDMFKLQEEIEEADIGEAAKIKTRINQIISEVKAELDEFFKSEDLKKCQEFVFKYKYLHKALENVNRKLP